MIIPTISTYLYEVTRHKQAMLTAMERRKAIRYCIVFLIVIAILIMSAVRAFAFPYDAINQAGDSTCKPPTGNENYYIRYDSSIGGHWEVTGHRGKLTNGTHTDSFRGSVSDTSINRTYTQADFPWLSDWAWLCPHTARICTFSLTISGGNVTGYATYAP